MTPTGTPISTDLPPEEFVRFRDWIHRHSGIFLEDQKADPLRISLVARATRHGFTEFDEYYRLLVNDEAEFKELLNLITINETSFFRFPAQFDALRTTVIPEILQNKLAGSKQFRVWSAGCSTGEEPYTIAMSLLESGLDSQGYRIEVLGTDVSTEALGKAKHAVYPSKSVANLAEDVVDRYFDPVKGGHRVRHQVRELVDFQYHNLIKEPYPLVLMGNWDIIFCRNVTIYFRLESTRRVVQNFFDSLNPGGYLFIGHSETLASISDKFEPVHTNEVFLYRKPHPRRLFTFDEILTRRTETERAEKAAAVSLERRRRGRRSAAAAVPASERRPAARQADRMGEAAPAGAVAQAENGPDVTVADPAALVAEGIDEVYALIESGDAPRAQKAGKELARLAPKDAQAQLADAFASAEGGDLDEAITAANRALEIDPLVAPARYILGVISQRRGLGTEAIEEFKRTLYIDRDFVLAHFNLANLYRSRGSMDDARREYENTLASLRANPQGEWTRFLGGFTSDLLAQTSERGLIDCRKGARTG
jgi:chemotaxis protein methyltransferase CheR